VQTVSNYPLVEAIHQNVVKHPILPDAVSRAKLTEKKSEGEHKTLGKKAVLFGMVDDTRNCDYVGPAATSACCWMPASPGFTVWKPAS